MKSMLWILATFCLVIGSFLSLQNGPYAWFLFLWGIGAFVIFGALAFFFPER